MAKRAARNPRPTGVIQAGVFFFREEPPAKPADAERHRHKGRSNTLMELPMKVASERASPLRF